MSTGLLLARPAWQDRWTKPSIEVLLEPYDVEQFEEADIAGLIGSIAQLERVQQSLTWYGTGWNWTIQYTVHDERGSELDVLCYVVPNIRGPIVSVPLQESMIAQLPLRRYSKYVREGVRLAKQAVQINWANWRPGNTPEMDQIFELIKSKHKYTLSPKKKRGAKVGG